MNSTILVYHLLISATLGTIQSALSDLSYGVQGARAGPLPRCSITTDGRQVDLDDFENTPGLPSEIDEQPLELDEPSGYLEPSAGYLNPPSIRHESHARR